jgi:S-adenosylmethionine synthetase
MARQSVFSSESVTRGHPDKICDQVSDGIVDAFLYLDPDAEVSAECAVATGVVFLVVNSTASVTVDVTTVAREVIADIGYSAANGFDPETCSVIQMSSHRALAEADRERLGPARHRAEPLVASHQASVFGYASSDTSVRMPLPIVLAHRVARGLDEARSNKVLPYLAPDGKTLVAVEFEDGRPTRVHTIIVNVQHAPALGSLAAPDAGRRRLEADIRDAVLDPAFADAPVAVDRRTRLLVNPAGAFVVGGPRRDAGLTGRKSIVDTYGGWARHGGGALSGKDPSHIDRLGAYLARYVARNVVAAGLARACEVHLSYALGEAHPLAIGVDTFGTGAVPDEALERAVSEGIDLRPASAIARFGLRDLPGARGGVFYRSLAAYGHFGRSHLDPPWEREDAAERLARAAGRLA